MSTKPKLKSLMLLALMLGLLVACVQNSGTRTLRAASKVGSGTNGVTVPGQNGATDNPGGTVGGSTTATYTTGKVEIRHIVNPLTGTYESKVSIPKNFTGTLYLSGLNIASLSNRLIYARFKFGRELESVTIPATIARGSGLTPQTDMEVVVLRMKNRPFENLRLLYDLYDYNTYSATATPTTDPRNAGLFCRGLKLENDPTFQGNLNNTACDAAGERCLYSYAKVVDSGLYHNSSGTWLANNPSSAQIDGSASSYATHVSTAANALNKCLPDGIDVNNVGGVLGTTIAAGTLTWDRSLTLGGTEYRYRGPYRPISQSLWQVSGGALFSDLTSGAEPTGLFQKTIVAGDPKGGYKSFLFPRAAKRPLRSSIQYWGASDPFADVRTLLSLSSSGDSEYMDGCNARLVDPNGYAPEPINACNVTGIIELFYKDPTTGVETIVATSRDVKLQLIRASETDAFGDEVIYTSMNSCNNSYSCGSEQCCFNNRCWSKNYVSQCSEDTPPVGNHSIGDTCKSDYDCSSLCCNQSTNTCQVHINTQEQKVLCSKLPGQLCVAKEWCRQEDVPTVMKIKKVVNGVLSCELRTYHVPTFGDCRNGICVQPAQPVAPTLDSTNPDCSDAVDPPTNL